MHYTESPNFNNNKLARAVEILMHKNHVKRDKSKGSILFNSKSLAGWRVLIWGKNL